MSWRGLTEKRSTKEAAKATLWTQNILRKPRESTWTSWVLAAVVTQKVSAFQTQQLIIHNWFMRL